MVVDKKLYSLRQYDLDQVLRVERGSLLSVPRRGTPRSVIYNYTLLFQAVNLIKSGFPGFAVKAGYLPRKFPKSLKPHAAWDGGGCKRSGLNAG